MSISDRFWGPFGHHLGGQKPQFFMFVRSKIEVGGPRAIFFDFERRNFDVESEIGILRSNFGEFGAKKVARLTKNHEGLFDMLVFELTQRNAPGW